MGSGSCQCLDLNPHSSAEPPVSRFSGMFALVGLLLQTNSNTACRSIAKVSYDEITFVLRKMDISIPGGCRLILFLSAVRGRPCLLPTRPWFTSHE
ncbi:hypothetical protein PoB_003703800 [Plakobranchus ocellatus]|uniref:Uncharacterized protein n=1 Tax=Plakobranchus ocellatus TaxID=259542 RepID=A0AAV4AUM9_9GAST|nr:hypothetical protein PoB_003703800 [Plakobranchus ocellatus]